MGFNRKHETSKTVFIFRTNNQLLISNNGQVEREKWEYLGNNSLLIDNSSGTYLFKHGFFDESLLALKLDSKNEYAIFINETKYNGDLNSFEKVLDFIRSNYLGGAVSEINIPATREKKKYNSDKGELEIESIGANSSPSLGDKVYKNNQLATDGKYKIGFMWYIKVLKGEITNITMI